MGLAAESEEKVPKWSLLIDVTGDETNFLQCIRAGVRGYLPRDVSAEDVVGAVKAIHGGQRSRLSVLSNYFGSTRLAFCSPCPLCSEPCLSC